MDGVGEDRRVGGGSRENCGRSGIAASNWPLPWRLTSGWLQHPLVAASGTT